MAIEADTDADDANNDADDADVVAAAEARLAI